MNNTHNDENWWASVLTDEDTQIENASTEPRSEENTFSIDWERVQELYKEDALLSLKVTGHNRGGVLVANDEMRGFVPYSHLSKVDNGSDFAERDEILSGYEGETIKLKLIECIPDENRIIFSERAAEVGAGKRRELFETLTENSVIEGEVTNITNFGVFVDIGGVEGLVHISELSWGRVGDPRQVVHMNQRLKVQILTLSQERCRVSLSIKRLQDNPWGKVQEKYQVGQILSVKITSLVPFGAFASLEENISGLIHSSEIPFVKQIYVKKGSELKVKILEIDVEKQRISLTLNLEERDD